MKKIIKVLTLSFLTLSVVSCSNDLQNTQAQIVKNQLTNSKYFLKGRVNFSSNGGFKTKSDIDSLGIGASVSIISGNQTIATGLTDDTGFFTINLFSNFTPNVGDIFKLEATRKLNDNPNNISIATHIKWTGSTWKSITYPDIYLNDLTTAITIISSLEPNTLSNSTTINSVNIPYSVIPSVGSVSSAKLLDLTLKVLTLIQEGKDPIANIKFEDNIYNSNNNNTIGNFLSSGDCQQCNLRNLNFSNTNMDSVYIKKSNMQSSNLSNSKLNHSSFDDSDLSNSNLNHLESKESSFNKTKFDNANMTYTNLSDSDFSETTAISSDISHSNLSMSNFDKTNFSQANLSNSDLSLSEFKQANFSGTQLSNSDLSGSNVIESNFSNVTANNINFEATDFLNSNLSNANMSGSNLSASSFEGTDISGLNLSGSNLEGVVFTGAIINSTVNLSNSNLQNADFRDVDTSKFNITGSDLRSARWFDGKECLINTTLLGQCHYDQ